MFPARRSAQLKHSVFRSSPAKCCLTLFFLFLQAASFAQQPAFFTLGEEQFRGTEIYDVVQDKKQNYWFATSEGIYVFDYYTYEKIECDKAKSNVVFGFTIGKDSSIYCHNLYNQVFRIREKKCELFYELKESETRSDISLAIAGDGNLLIAGRMLIVLNKDGSRVERYYPGKTYLGPAFKMESGNVIYHLADSDSVISYRNGKVSRLKLNFPEQQGKLPNVLKFFRRGKSSFALDLKTKSLYRFDPLQNSLYTEQGTNPFAGKGVVRIYETGKDAWFADAFTGVTLLSGDEPDTAGNIYYPDYFISDVFKDKEGNILLSTFDKGVLVIPDLQVPDVISNFRDDPVVSLHADPELGLLLGTSKGELLNYHNGKTTSLQAEGLHTIEAVYGSPVSSQIIFDNGKIRAYNTKTGTTTDLMNFSLKDVAFVSENVFYLGMNIGLTKIQLDKEPGYRSEFVPGMNMRVYTVEYDPKDSSLYASTANGLYVIDAAGNARKILHNNSEVYPIDLHCFSGGVMASMGKNGILVLNRGQITEMIRPALNGKPAAIKKILVVNQFIFANSSEEFFQFDMKGNLVRSLHTSFHFSSHHTMDFSFDGKTLWVCHSGGVQPIDLSYPEPAAPVPLIRLEGIYVNDQPADLAAHGRFESDQRKLVFVLLSPTLRNRETISYHYRLIGYDTSWTTNSYAANRIIYNALAPGTYVLQVKAEDRGVFSPPVSYTFTIASPFYLRWWFITAIVTVFLLLVYLVYRWQLSLQRKKSRQLSELNASKLTAIQSQMNPHFIFNSLNSIQDLILKGDIEHSYSYITTFSNLVRRTLNYSEKDFIDFEQEIKLLELYLSLEKLRFRKALDYEIRINGISDIQVPPLLIQPFIENALVHGLLHKEGEKRLSISFGLDDMLTCKVEDNGVGREKAKSIKQRQRSEHESFSGKAIHKRFEILSQVFGGDFGYTYEDLYENGEPSGTRVTLRIPVKHKF